MEDNKGSNQEGCPSRAELSTCSNFGVIPRIPSRPSALLAALTRPQTFRVPSSTANLQLSTFNRNDQNLSSKDDNFASWLSQYPRNNIFGRHILYKVAPTDWLDIEPKQRFVRLRPQTEHNLVLTMTTHKNMLLMGLGMGQIMLYDLNSMNLVRSYTAHDTFGVRQIVTGRKPNRFFASAYNEFVEYSYYDSNERFRFKNQSFIKAILADSYPMLLVDSEGFVHQYSEDDPLLRISPLGSLFGKINSIEELRAYDPNIPEQTRPCLVRNQCCIAIVDLSLTKEAKITVWRKELLTSNPEDNIATASYEEKLFFTVIPIIITNTIPIIYVTKFKDIGYASRVEIIKPTGGLLTNIKTSDDYLVTISRSQQVEIFDCRTNIKKFHIIYGQGINSVFISRNILIAGTQSGSVIIQELTSKEDKVCLHCENYFQFESNGVYKRCPHFIPPEMIVPCIQI